MFYPQAHSYKSIKPQALYKQIARTRRREYGERVLQCEDGDFTPMILSSSGGMGAETSMVIKRLAEKVSEKQNLAYSMLVICVRCSRLR